MADYIVNKTDIAAAPIDVPEKRVDSTALDVALFGKIRLEYGERLNEDLLNVLENFACPELASSSAIIPDVSQTSMEQLTNPTEGQLWYNSTRELIYFWTGSVWSPTQSREDMAANWGQIMHGGQLPRPVSPTSGYIFPYSECIWTVAPSVFTGKIGYMACATDPAANVTMQYRFAGTNDVVPGVANYLIVGIRNGTTETGPFPTPPAPSPTATPTPTLTPTMTQTVTPTVTPTVTITRTMSPTPTPQPTSTPTPQPSNTPTPTSQPSPTPQPSVTPTPQVSSTPTPSPIPITAIILGGNYNCFSQVVTNASAGAGVGFQINGTSTKTGLNTSGPTRWLAAGYDASDFEVSFTGDYMATFPANSWYSTPAGNNTMGTPGAWYNLSSARGWSCGTNRDMVNFTVGYTIRQISTGRTVSGGIQLGGISGTPI